MSMKLQDDCTPVALYARVSSDRQDVDLSVSAQLRALRDYAEKHDYLVALAPQTRPVANAPGRDGIPFRRWARPREMPPGETAGRRKYQRGLRPQLASVPRSNARRLPSRSQTVREWPEPQSQAPFQPSLAMP